MSALYVLGVSDVDDMLNQSSSSSDNERGIHRSLIIWLFSVSAQINDPERPEEARTRFRYQIPLTNLKRFGDRAFCAYAPRLWNELPDNIKAADSVQNFKKQLKTLLFRKEFNWLYGPWQLSNDSKALLNIIGGKGAISNINYYYY